MAKNTSSNSFTWLSFGMTHAGKVRKYNEDSMLNKPEIGLWAVADGMGGHESGGTASQMIVKSLGGINAAITLDKYIDDIEDRLLTINQRLLEKAQKSKEKITIGSTVVGMIAYDRFCTFFWAGDSRLYRLRNRSLRQLSIDHSQVEIYIKQGMLNRKESIKHPQNNVITRAIGACKNLYVDFDIQEMQRKDRYMLCSDGLTKHIQNIEFEEILGKNSTENTCKQLIALTLERGAGDNVTAIIIDIH